MSPFTPWGRPCSITHSTLCASSFFFSSRRRHTRFDCDRSSDVCSSDLCAAEPLVKLLIQRGRCAGIERGCGQKSFSESRHVSSIVVLSILPRVDVVALHSM